jgi:hypothetical protein
MRNYRPGAKYAMLSGRAYRADRDGSLWRCGDPAPRIDIADALIVALPLAFVVLGLFA